MHADSPEPLLTSKANGRRMLGDIGSTKFDELIASGQVESVKIGSRRLVVIESLRRLAGV
ncbi:hypothetical protein GCM10010990_08970 [Croceicoccus mobilis]|uniref:Excisionase n=1 Tax=Croceicoccus mobilis TaxID=1703339 RepID=A0A916YVM8_9SPHN|nr:hypothetical protein GCM10010990_08970 [Croceicoccus mobilis]